MSDDRVRHRSAVHLPDKVCGLRQIWGCGLALGACLFVSCGSVAQTPVAQVPSSSAVVDNSGPDGPAQATAPAQRTQSDGGIGDWVEREGCTFSVRRLVNPVLAAPGDLTVPGKWPTPEYVYVGVDIVVASVQGACKATVTIPSASARLFGSDGSMHAPKIGGLKRQEDYGGLTLDPGTPGQDNTGMIYFEVPVGFMPAALQWNFVSPPIVIQIDLAR